MGTFQQKIGIREMVIVALVSFGIGLTLRFGIASNPWIQDGDALHAMANYLKENSKNVEVIVGVILPIILLVFFECKMRTEDQWALVLEAKSQELQNLLAEQEISETPLDPFPALMVIYSLIVIATWLTIIAVRETEGRTVLIGVSIVLIIAAGLIKITINKIQNKASRETAADLAIEADAEDA